jgi:hypothetical protein
LRVGAIAADAPQKPKLKIVPGQVIVPTGPGEMRRIWGELISIDAATRTGKFRNEGDDSVMGFTVMPYAELLHHAANGDLQDFRVGERAIFRLHENEQGEWHWLTYIQDEMNMLKNHGEYFHVDKIDASLGTLLCTWANSDKSFVRSTDVLIETDAQTRFWREGKPAVLGDVRMGDKLRTKTHGTGGGKRRIAWEVFLDEESLLKFQAEQIAVHSTRMRSEGAPGYVDSADARRLRVTLFNEGQELWKDLKPGNAVRVVPAAPDRKPKAAPRDAKVVELTVKGRVCQVAVDLDDAEKDFQPPGLVRVFPSSSTGSGAQR